MWPLVYKDLLLQRRTKFNLIIISILCLVSSITLSTNATYAYFAIIMTAYLTINYAHGYDFKYKTEALFRSLPISPDQIVTAKYITILIALGLPILIILLLRCLLGIIGFFPIGQLIHFEFLVQVIGIGLIYFSVFLPFYYKLGYMKCRWAIFVGMGIAYGLPLSMVKIAEHMMKEGTIQRPDNWFETSQEFLELLTGISTKVWNPLFLACAAVITLLSFFLSLKIYRRKECEF